MLFNVKEDPHEQRDVKDAAPGGVRPGGEADPGLAGPADDEVPQYPVDPMLTVLQEGGPYHTWVDLDQYLRRLDATGRKEGADALRKKYRRG